MRSLLNVRGLHVSFAGNEVVRGIDFSIARGERVALVGESGSGKTVTALSLLGLAQHARVAGRAEFMGQDLLAMPEHGLRGLRGQAISMIFQEPMTALNPLYTVGQQIAEVLELKRGLSRKDAAQEVIQLLTDTGITEAQRCAASYPHQLSGGQRQRAVIAMALACQPQLLLADEPTTALDAMLRGQILNLLLELQARLSMAVLMITHDLNLVRRFAQRVIVMESGRIVEQGMVSEVFAKPQQPYTRHLIDSLPVRDVRGTETNPACVLRAQALAVGYRIRRPGLRGWFKADQFQAVQALDFDVGRGQTLGVIGESGSGKSTLALAALGLLPSTGSMQVAGQTWGRGRAHDKALRRVLQVVFQDPFSSLSPRMTLQEIVGEGLRQHEPALTDAARCERVVAALRDVGMGVGLDAAAMTVLLQRYPHEFSGGQRQRLAIARALIIRPEVLVLDEPTSALDVTVQKQILQLLQNLQKERSLSYLLITHDLAVVRAMAHQVLVLKTGQVVESGTVEQVLGAPQQAYTQALVKAFE